MEYRKLLLADLICQRDALRQNEKRLQDRIDDIEGPAKLSDFLDSHDEDLLSDVHDSDCVFQRTQCIRGTVFIDYVCDRYEMRFQYKSRKDKLKCRIGSYSYKGNDAGFGPLEILQAENAWQQGRQPLFWTESFDWDEADWFRLAGVECGRINALALGPPNAGGCGYRALKEHGLTPGAVVLLMLYALRNKRE